MANLRIERGGEDPFAMGRGYQPPSLGADAPDWGQDYTHEVLQPAPVSGEQTMGGMAAPISLPSSDMDIEAAVASMVADLLPREYVNLDKCFAHFRGHEVALSPETIATIEDALALSVEVKLKGEMDRVKRSVRDKGLQTNPNAGLAHLREVQGSASELGKQEPNGPTKVLRVRKSRAPKVAKNVPVVQGSEDDQAPPRDAA